MAFQLIKELITTIGGFLYSGILIAVGLFFTIKTKFVQIRMFPEAIKSVTEKSHDKKVSSFQALMISTASRVGTGNIAGIALAIVTGGPGSIFWMWVMAIIGSASAFAESTLAQVYKIKDGKNYLGGPAYYIERALKKRWLGIIFAVFLIACMVYGLNVVQAYNISSSVGLYIPNYKQTIYPYLIGIILVIITAAVIFGGVHRIGFVSSYIVPAMALFYIILGLYITIVNIDKVPQMFKCIFESAFDFKSIFGGFAGSSMLIGIRRGLFSNEAGMGSAPNAAATADVSHPVKQGLVQIVSVCIDTLIICTTSAFIILLSGVKIEKGGLNGIPLVQAAIESQVGSIGMHFMTISILMFAFTSIIGNYCYAESNVLFIKNNKTVLNIFRCTCLIAVFVGTQASLKVWNLADLLMAFMAIVNIFAMFALSKVVLITLKDYIAQKKSGKDPKFCPKELGIKDTEAWD